MKRCVCLALIILLLTGCRSLYPDDYLSVESNQAPYAYRETDATTEKHPSEAEQRIQTVSTLGEIRQGIQDLVDNGQTSGCFLLHDYRGDTDNLPETVRNHLTSYTPKYVYAMRDLELRAEDSGEDILLDVSYTPTMSPEEFGAIPTSHYYRSFNLICEALQNYLSSFTIEIIGYTDTDYEKVLEEYCIEHPDEIIEIPQVSVRFFPAEEGIVRVLSFQFRYQTEPENLKWQQKTVDSLLDIFQLRLQDDDEAEGLLEDLYMLLVPAGGYTNDENATAFSLFISKVGSSRMMAAVAAYFCRQSGKECGVVIGEHETVLDDASGDSIWKPWYWNWIRDGNRYLFFDLHDAALKGTKPVLLTAEEMTGYRWDTEKYRDLETIEEPEPTEPTEPTEPVEPTEPAEQTEPAEPAEQTEPAEPAEQTEQPTEQTEPTEPAEASDPTDQETETDRPVGSEETP